MDGEERVEMLETVKMLERVKRAHRMLKALHKENGLISVSKEEQECSLLTSHFVNLVRALRLDCTYEFLDTRDGEQILQVWTECEGVKVFAFPGTLKRIQEDLGEGVKLDERNKTAS